MDLCYRILVSQSVLDQGPIVIPIFYYIDPLHTSKPLQIMRENRYSKWKVVLTEVANLVINYQLEKEDEISPALIKATENSDNYASLEWCLAELGQNFGMQERPRALYHNLQNLAELPRINGDTSVLQHRSIPCEEADQELQASLFKNTRENPGATNGKLLSWKYPI
ncbi:hypothetical protein CR513_41987, partial [Mucuna pruriens]